MGYTTVITNCLSHPSLTHHPLPVSPIAPSRHPATPQGKYTVYAPGSAVDAAYRLRVDGRNTNVLYSSADAPAWQTDLSAYFTPGEFVSVQGQVRPSPAFASLSHTPEPSFRFALTHARAQLSLRSHTRPSPAFASLSHTLEPSFRFALTRLAHVPTSTTLALLPHYTPSRHPFTPSPTPSQPLTHP